MREEFYISYSCAAQLDGFGNRLLREPPRERVDALMHLLRQLLQSNVDPGQKHNCPICSQEMNISFEFYIEFPKELDISTDCKTCNIAVFSKSNRIPSWARAISLLDLPGFFD